MNTHLINVAEILLSFPLLLCITLGWGRCIRSIFGVRSHALFSFDDAWIGLICITLVSELSHFFIPINWVLGLEIAILGLAFLLSLGISRLKIELARTWNFITIHPWICIAVLLTCMAWISRSMDSVNNYDTGLYHLQTIQWLNEHQIVKGLANLHSRFGFNQSYFSFLALLNVSPFWLKGYALGNIFLLALAVGTLFSAKFFTRKSGWWLLISLSFAIGVVAQKIAAPSPDFAIGILQIVVFIKTIECLSDDNLGFSQNIAVLLMLCAFMLTVKLSSVIYGASMAITVIWVRKIYFKENLYLLLKTSVVCLAIILVHYSRGFFLSGFPLYPSLFLGLPNLPWSIPAEKAILEAQWIYSFAKNPLSSPDLVLGNWGWVKIWIERQSLSLWRFLAIDFALLIVNFALFMKTASKYEDKKWLSIYIPLLASLIFWFLIAPDWRFLGSIPELIIALAGWLCLRAMNISPKLPIWANSALNKQVLGIAIFLMTFRVIHIATLPTDGWQPWPSEKIIQKYTESGLMIYTPSAGELCWDAPLPCAAEFNPQLELIPNEKLKTTLGSGFLKKPR